MALSPDTRAPDWTLPDLQNATMQLSQLGGAPVLLCFFDINCSWCAVEVPRLNDVLRRNPDIGVRFVGVCLGGTAEQAANFAREHELSFPVVLDASAGTARAYELERVPTVVLVDAAGNVACVYEGSSEQLAGIVEQTVLAAVEKLELPNFSLVGNGCAPP